ncbi:hypothetical protein J437_LFUL009629, partial [Ladona fulva]
MKKMSTPMSDMSGDSTLGTLTLRDKALIKRNISRHHNSNFKAGYVPVHEPSLGRTGVRGRKTVVLWALVLLLFALAAANLCLTLTVLGVLRVGHGMEAIEFLSELGILKFRGVADLDRVTKRDGRIQGFAGSPVEISGDGGSVLIDLGTSISPRISLDEEGISMNGLESLDVFVHDGFRGQGLPGLISSHSPPAVFSTRFPNFGLPRGVSRLDVLSVTAKRLSAPVNDSLFLRSSSRVRLRGSEGAVLDGRELAWSADQDILLRSVNGSILLNGSEGVALDVRSVPLVPLPLPVPLRQMRAVAGGMMSSGGRDGKFSDSKENRQRRMDSQHKRGFHAQPNRGTANTSVSGSPKRLKPRRLHKTLKQMSEAFEKTSFGTVRVVKNHIPSGISGEDVYGASYVGM